MRSLSALIAIACLAGHLAAVAPAGAQTAAGPGAPPAVLVADSLFITPDKVLIARGNVEAFQGTTRIRATEIRYDQRLGSLEIIGPITLRDGDDVTILADAAKMDARLQTALLTGARLILSQQLQLAAVQINHIDGRYSQLYKTAVTSCDVCDDGRPPLWQIRAKRVVHDQANQQLYFDEAQFRIRSVPVFYIPRLRLPDPTQDRATGFLTPSLRSTSKLGTGIKVPYFIKLGDHRDLTLAPYFSGATRTLEFRYRQAFVAGRIEFNGAVTNDDIDMGGSRGYLFGTGSFDLKRNFKLSFQIETTSDDTYLKDYDYSDDDRLTNNLVLSRTRRDAYAEVGIVSFRSLRVDEDNETLPGVVLDGRYERRYFPSALGGELRLTLAAHSHYRRSSLATDSDDADLIADGRDVSRLNLDAHWLRAWTIAGGLRLQAEAGTVLDHFKISQDNAFAQTSTALSPFAAVTLRYPMSRRTAAGVTQFVEPLAQVGWLRDNPLNLPGGESTRVEFDAGNLLSLSRFPAPDRRERGTVAAIGTHLARFDPAGWETTLTFGQIIRANVDRGFTQTSGLTGTTSDILVAGQLKAPNGLNINARSLFDEKFDFSKAELRANWSGKRIRMSGSYLWLTPDAAEDRDSAVSEVSFDGVYRISSNWSIGADLSYDLSSNRSASTELGVTYLNECVTVDLSARRRYITSTSVESETSLGLSIGLRGFSARSGTESFTRSCKQ